MTEARKPSAMIDPEARWDAIRRKLEANADVLATRGTLVAKEARGRRIWAVRFGVTEGGRRVHKAIYIAGEDRPELIERTRRWLEDRRTSARWADEVQGYARLAARAGGIARRLATGRGRPG